MSAIGNETFGLEDRVGTKSMVASVVGVSLVDSMIKCPSVLSYVAG